MALRGSKTEDDHRRALLFGAHQRRPAGGGAGPAGSSVAMASERESLEVSNSQAVDGLRGRVGEMRHLALDLGTEVREQNGFLEGMGGTFDDAGSALKRTMTEVKRLATSRGGGHVCVLTIMAFVFVLLVYLLLR